LEAKTSLPKWKAYCAEAVERLKAVGAPPVDGAYVLTSSKPCADGKVLLEARTRAQRKVRRLLAARGKFCGFYPVEST